MLPVIIYAESTPNPATMKFVANRPLVNERTVEYTDPTQAKGSPLATELFRFPFVKGVYFASNFVTITKSPAVDWVEVMNELREYIREFLDSGKEPVKDYPEPVVKETAASSAAPLNPTEAESKIIEILEEYIKPAVEQDGGEIAFRSFEDGVVNVVLRGSCSGCPSSTLTLKAGIEQLLKRMVPGVESVVAENE
jgi:Fe-S cluster biogenesis protein NfuA